MRMISMTLAGAMCAALALAVPAVAQSTGGATTTKPAEGTPRTGQGGTGQGAGTGSGQSSGANKGSGAGSGGGGSTGGGSGVGTREKASGMATGRRTFSPVR